MLLGLILRLLDVVTPPPAAAQGEVQPIYLVPAGEALDTARVRVVNRRLAEVQRWYGAVLDGRTFHMAPLVIQRSRHALAEVGAGNEAAWWRLLQQEGKAYGYDWEGDELKVLWIVFGAGGWSAGDSDNGRMRQSYSVADDDRGAIGGMAVVGDSAIGGVLNGTCPEQGMGRESWWCSGTSFAGVVAHELGHTWGLPDPGQLGLALRCADDLRSTVMQCQWKFPNDSLLTYERRHLQRFTRWFLKGSDAPPRWIRRSDVTLLAGSVADLAHGGVVWLSGRGGGTGYRQAVTLDGRVRFPRVPASTWLEFDIGFEPGQGRSARLSVYLDGLVAYDRRLKAGDPPLRVRVRLRGAGTVEMRATDAVTLAHLRWH